MTMSRLQCNHHLPLTSSAQSPLSKTMESLDLILKISMTFFSRGLSSNQTNQARWYPRSGINPWTSSKLTLCRTPPWSSLSVSWTTKRIRESPSMKWVPLGLSSYSYPVAPIAPWSVAALTFSELGRNQTTNRLSRPQSHYSLRRILILPISMMMIQPIWRIKMIEIRLLTSNLPS
jgi:hypothetical protein